jgi:hypothetical protein
MIKLVLILIVSIFSIACSTETITTNTTTINNNYYYGTSKDSIVKIGNDTILIYPILKDTIING